MKRTEDSANSSAGRRRRGTPSTSSGLAGLLCLARDRSPLAATFPDSPSLTTHPPTQVPNRPRARVQAAALGCLRASDAGSGSAPSKERQGNHQSASVPATARPQCGALPAECRPRAYKIRSTRPSDSPPTQAEERAHTHTRPLRLRPRCSRVAGPDRDEARSAALGSPRAR